MTRVHTHGCCSSGSNLGYTEWIAMSAIDFTTNEGLATISVALRRGSIAITPEGKKRISRAESGS